MNTVATEMNAAATAVAGDRLRNYVWLIKRELWEHRRFFLAPLIVSAIVVCAVLYGITRMSDGNVKMDGAGIHFNQPGVAGTVSANEAMLRGAHFIAFASFAAPFFIVMFFVTLHYTLDTLYADRRDRSILFWKSLPLSDLETVLSKLFVAVVVSPLVTLVIALATQFLVYILLSIGFAIHGMSVSVVWTGIPYFESLVLLLYALLIVSLWYLPIWAWCLLASSWAQRAVFLWATVPIGAVWLFEYLALGTNHVGEFLRTRTSGMWELAAHVDPETVKAISNRTLTTLHVTDFITPGVYFSSPQLWIGLLLTVGLVAATVWVRRIREAA